MNLSYYKYLFLVIVLAILNASINCIDRHALNTPEKIAIIWECDDPKISKKITYKELLENVNKAKLGFDTPFSKLLREDLYKFSKEILSKSYKEGITDEFINIVVDQGRLHERISEILAEQDENLDQIIQQ